MHIYTEEHLNVFGIFFNSIILTNTISQMDNSLQAAGKQLRYSVVFSALV